MEKISWTDRVRSEELLHRVKKERNIIHRTKRRKTYSIGHILRRNCVLKHIFGGRIEGTIDVTGRQGRKGKQLLDDLKATRGYSKLKEKAVDRIMWGTRCGRGYGPLVRQTT